MWPEGLMRAAGAGIGGAETGSAGSDLREWLDMRRWYCVAILQHLTRARPQEVKSEMM